MKPCSNRQKIALALAASFVAIASGCATPRPATTTAEPRPSVPSSVVDPAHELGRQAECVPRFPDHDGWYGGDAAYSVPLPTDDQRNSLWLFGDTFVHRPDGPDARSYPFVHNSIGVSRCDPDGRFRLETYWGRDETGDPAAYFEPDPNADWIDANLPDSGVAAYYWPLDGFIAHDTLFVGLLRVVHAEPNGPFNLPFRLAGVDLARIENHRDSPPEWRIQISTLSDDSDAFPGGAFVVTGRHVWAFAFFGGESGKAGQIVSRLDLDALVEWRPDLAASLETFGADGKWRAGFEPERAAALMRDPASEMSVHFDAADESWIAVYSDLSPRASLEAPIPIRIRTAPRLEGPWSRSETLVTIPESRPGDPRSGDENLFCYAGKAHPQFSTRGRLLVTYVCNLYARDPGDVWSVLERLRSRTDLYRPRPISVRRPEPARPGASE